MAITQEEVWKIFQYDTLSGNLFWRDTGKVVGCLDGGYIRTQINRKRYPIHRLIWIYMNGKIEDGLFIDHINGNRLDNRIQNLRKVTPKTNTQNIRKPTAVNKVGYLGVHFDVTRNKYRASIRLDGKKKTIGRYETAEKAHQAYLVYKRKYHEGCTI